MTTLPPRGLTPLTIAAILVTAVLVNASDYSFLVPLRDVRTAAHQAVVTGTALSPARYRVLVPMALDVPIRALATVMPYDKAFGRVYAVFHLIALAALLGMLVVELSHWFTAEQAMVGALLVGATIRIALRQGEYLDNSSIPLTSVFAPQSLVDPIVLSAGFVLAVRNRQRWFGLLAVVAALNSEAAALLPFLYFAVNGPGRTAIITAGIYAVLVGVVSIGVHLAVGGPFLSMWRFDEVWSDNLAHAATTMINLALFIGPLWLLAVPGLRRAPREVRRASWLIPVYLSAIALFGLWWDVRQLMGLYPLILPLVLSAMFTPRSRQLHDPAGLATTPGGHIA